MEVVNWIPNSCFVSEPVSYERICSAICLKDNILSYEKDFEGLTQDYHLLLACLDNLTCTLCQ